MFLLQSVNVLPLEEHKGFDLVSFGGLLHQQHFHLLNLILKRKLGLLLRLQCFPQDHQVLIKKLHRLICQEQFFEVLVNLESLDNVLFMNFSDVLFQLANLSPVFVILHFHDGEFLVIMHELLLLILENKLGIIFFLLHSINLPLEVCKTKSIGHGKVATKHILLLLIVELFGLGAVDVHNLAFDVGVGLRLHIDRDVAYADSLSGGAILRFILIL